MGDYLYKMVLTFVSVSAFALQDKMKLRTVFIAVIGGVLTFTAEYFFVMKSENTFLIYFLSAGVTCLYSEIMARINKVPATIIMLSAVIPLVPGSIIYYSMRGLLENRYDIYITNLIEALLSAGGIASAVAVTGVLTGTYKKIVEIWLKKVNEIRP